MFDKIGRAAERAAAGVSRRNFFGQLGRGAATVAAGLGGVLLSGRDARAGSNGQCCYYVSPNYTLNDSCTKGPCPKKVGGTPEGGSLITVRCSDYPSFCPQ